VPEASRRSWRETCELNRGKPGFDPEKLSAFRSSQSTSTRKAELDGWVLGLWQSCRRVSAVASIFRLPLAWRRLRLRRNWFDTRPNLRKEMEARHQRFSDKDDIVPLLRARAEET
jgi:hypothetical protein